jgi:hypothetical protein
MGDKRINVSFYLVVIFFLVIILVLIKDSNTQRLYDYKVYRTVVANIVRMENHRINVLVKENADLKHALAATK